MSQDYILFLCQEANFQTRSILIPAKEFIDARKDEYEMLLSQSKKNISIIINDKEHIIDNLLIRNIIWKDGLGRPEIKPYTQFCGILCQYAYGLNANQYIDLRDKPWYDKSKINLCKGFNHVLNYTKCSKLASNKINIINGFLVLQAEDGYFYKQPFDTEEEYDAFYESEEYRNMIKN